MPILLLVVRIACTVWFGLRVRTVDGRTLPELTLLILGVMICFRLLQSIDQGAHWRIIFILKNCLSSSGVTSFKEGPLERPDLDQHCVPEASRPRLTATCRSQA
jgi:hypothetical protein